MRKKAAMAVLMVMMLPAMFSNSDYVLKNTATHIIERKGSTVSFKKQKPLVTKLTRFALRHGANNGDAVEFAVALSRTKHPTILARIGARESGFNPKAHGTLDDSGAYQVRESNYGKVPEDIHGQTRQAERAFNDKLKRAKGNVWKAVEFYNGSGPKARSYAQHIKNMKMEV